MAKARTIRVVGEVMADVIVSTGAPTAWGSDTPARVRDVDGGSAANLAAWLAELGMRVALMARVGGDEHGRRVLRHLEAAGVSLDVSSDPDVPTGRCVVVVTPDGERTMFADPGANSGLRAADLGTAAWQADDHLHVSGYSLLREGSRNAALTALRNARGRGLTVSVDASSEAPLLAVGAETFLAWLGEGDLVFANAAEARALTGRSRPDEAVAELARRGLLAVVKTGADGAVAGLGDERWQAPAVAASARDTTGAGDAFAAGFLAEWVRQGDVAAALRLATQTAARAIGQPGGRP
jgi:sugar/nucleoside kinase (ribokinase family)